MQPVAGQGQRATRELCPLALAGYGRARIVHMYVNM